jgi:hypothetical protein
VKKLPIYEEEKPAAQKANVAVVVVEDSKSTASSSVFFPVIKGAVETIDTIKV